jgi:hypothetical protein
MFEEIIEVSDSEGEKSCTEVFGQDNFIQREADDSVMLVWPFTPEEKEEFAGATIINNHAKHLKIGCMYNDEMLNFGISYFTKWLCPNKQLRSKTFIYSSLFYTKLIEPPSAESGIRRLDLHGRFRNVQRWHRKVNVFKRKILLYPIHEGLHYFFICYVQPSVLLNDELADLSTDETHYPCVLVFDSIQRKTVSKYSIYVKMLNEYLVLAWMRFQCTILDVCRGDISTDILLQRINRIGTVLVPCPQQPLGDLSCGAYVVRNAAMFVQQQPHITQDNVRSGQILDFWKNSYDHQQIVKDRSIMFEFISSLIVEYRKFLSKPPTSDEGNDSPGCEIIKTSICNTSNLKKRRVSTTDLTRCDDDESPIMSSNVQKSICDDILKPTKKKKSNEMTDEEWEKKHFKPLHTFAF